MKNSNAALRKKLKAIIKSNPRGLKEAVAREALDYEGDVNGFFSDLQKYGCVSGMVSILIYYSDTHQFYDTHYDEIEQLRFDLEESLGQPLQPNGDLKNWYAWLAFEETARSLVIVHRIFNNN